MHWIERGPEPARLEPIRNTYTQPWIDFYHYSLGGKPRDSRWREFKADLAEEFHSLCAYCEETTLGEVDHFRPKKVYPQLVYVWSNWLLACRACNQTKSEKWPAQGYLDPSDEAQCPAGDRYFDFDFVTGHVDPSQLLSEEMKVKVQNLIDDLGLNLLPHLKRRKFIIEILERTFGECDGTLTPKLEGLRVLFIDRTVDLSSLSRAWLSSHNYLEVEE